MGRKNYTGGSTVISLRTKERAIFLNKRMRKHLKNKRKSYLQTHIEEYKPTESVLIKNKDN